MSRFPDKQVLKVAEMNEILRILIEAALEEKGKE